MSNYPFNKAEELKDVGCYIAAPAIYGGNGKPTKKFNTPITPKENLLRVFRGEKPAWLPYMLTDANILQPIVMPDAFARRFGGIDWFGIDWQFEPTANAAMVRPGTRRLSDITEWENELVFPDLKDMAWERDYNETKPFISEDKATIFTICNGFFERLADLTSFEDSLCALLTDPDEVCAFFDKLADWHIELCKIAHDVYHADIITLHDDLGTQRSSFISPDTYEEILLPYHKRVVDAIHEMGMFATLHSCGNIANMMPGIIAAGFDCWEGQNNANDKNALMAQYGDQLAQFSSYHIPADYTEEQYEALLNEMVTVSGGKGRLALWIRDPDEEREAWAREQLYCKSREFYASQD